MADSIDLSTEIAAPPAQVWKALTDPQLIKSYMMGATVETDWKVGHPITWSGEWKGKPYQDKGVIKAFEPNKRLSMTHWSPLTPLADEPANYHTVTYDLAAQGGGTRLTLTQENLTGVSPEQARKNWQPMLDALKRTAEG